MTNPKKYRVQIDFAPGVLAPTFEAIAWADTRNGAIQKAVSLACECGWADQKVQRVTAEEIAETLQ